VRVLLVNAFHYLRGGVERTYFDETRWLAAAGHQVAHLSTRDPRNLPSPTAHLFAPGADFGEGVSVTADPSRWTRVLWSRPAAAAMRRVIEEFKPDIAHAHAPSRHLTPSVLRPLEAAGVPVVMTLHDFKPWCTNRLLFAHGAPCERCKGGRHVHALLTGCVQDSRAKSAVAMVEAYLHDALRAYRAVRLWVAPSCFVRDKAIEHGVAFARLRVLSHGLEAVRAPDAVIDVPDRPYALYAGRLSVEKGVRLLPGIAQRIAPAPLLVVGDGPLWGEIEAASRTTPNLRPLGYRSDEELATLRRRAGAVVVPSLFYEHFCYAAAEAMLDARPVAASRIGAIPELVEHEVTGLLAPPGDAEALGQALRRALEEPAATRWAVAGRARVQAMCDPKRHVDGLVTIYREAIGA
jgi:glycosyltransferase involved in cell wall biosynthesis